LGLKAYAEKGHQIRANAIPSYMIGRHSDAKSRTAFDKMGQPRIEDVEPTNYGSSTPVEAA
jgi:hypothetical protein